MMHRCASTLWYLSLILPGCLVAQRDGTESGFEDDGLFGRASSGRGRSLGSRGGVIALAAILSDLKHACLPVANHGLWVEERSRSAFL